MQMTHEQLVKLLKDNNIPSDAILTSNSGWECGATDLERVYYSRKENTIVFTQDFNDFHYDNAIHGWVRLYNIT